MLGGVAWGDTQRLALGYNPPMHLHEITLDRLQAFLAVIEAGGFTAAARKLRVGKNAVSQRIAKLERQLHLPLFTRSSRKVVPTTAGQRLYQECSPLLVALAQALETIGNGQLAGRLRITAPSDYASAVLCRALVDFGTRYPHVQVDLVTDSRPLDLIDRGLDAAVRLGWPRDSSLRAVQIGEFELIAVASPAYLAKVGELKHPSELARCELIALSVLERPAVWRFSGGDGVVNVHMRIRHSASTAEGMLGLVRSGAGIAITTDFSAHADLRDGALKKLLLDWRLPRAGIYLTWPKRQVESKTVRVLIDFLRQWFHDHTACHGGIG